MIADIKFYLSDYADPDMTDVPPHRVFVKAWMILQDFCNHRLNEINGVWTLTTPSGDVPLLDSEIYCLKMAMCNLVSAEVELSRIMTQSFAGSQDERNIKSRSSGEESVVFDTLANPYVAAIKDSTGKAKQDLYRDTILAYAPVSAFRYNPYYGGV